MAVGVGAAVGVAAVVGVAVIHTDEQLFYFSFSAFL